MGRPAPPSSHATTQYDAFCGASAKNTAYAPPANCDAVCAKCVRRITIERGVL